MSNEWLVGGEVCTSAIVGALGPAQRKKCEVTRNSFPLQGNAVYSSPSGSCQESQKALLRENPESGQRAECDQP